MTGDALILRRRDLTPREPSLAYVSHFRGSFQQPGRAVSTVINGDCPSLPLDRPQRLGRRVVLGGLGLPGLTDHATAGAAA
jgi:hypothetical protein